MSLRRWFLLGLILLVAVAGVANAGYLSSHWRPSSKQVVVYVVDYTDSHYPVDQAAGEWTTPEITFAHAFACPAYRACVNVSYSATLPANEIGSEISYHLPANPAITYHAEIRLTTHAANLSQHERLTLACHELGHALGLDHDASGSCLVPFVSPTTPTTPSASDFSELRSLYGAG